MGLVYLSPVVIPAVCGVIMLIISAACKWKDLPQPEGSALKRVHIFACAVLAVSAALALYSAWGAGDWEVRLFTLLDAIPIYSKIDNIGRVFATVMVIVLTLIGIYSTVYMSHEGEERRFFGFFMVVFGVLMALCFSGNLITMYLFYEMMTLTSVPLVLHNGSHEALMAALKYLFYSMCGAYLALFAIFWLAKYCDSLVFTPGGTLNLALLSGNEKILLAAIFCSIIGFGVKAGMLPLHAWLPTAHPVAPSPASAALSGIIVKCGVLGIIRVVYYIAGADFIRGTWVQTAWIVLSLMTVFMGSMLAFREPVFKKRLAYSTVSQVSYILFGLSLLNPTAFTGALLHVVFHAFIKSALFLTAGIFIFKCHKTRVEELRGIGKQMPVTLWMYTFASLALIGIPPASGFISKWYLALGALRSGMGAVSFIGPAVLLVSALLTAGYLLPVTIDGFFPGKGFELKGEKQEPKAAMLVPLAIMAICAIVFGILPNPMIEFFSAIAETVL